MKLELLEIRCVPFCNYHKIFSRASEIVETWFKLENDFQSSKKLGKTSCPWYIVIRDK